MHEDAALWSKQQRLCIIKKQFNIEMARNERASQLEDAQVDNGRVLIWLDPMERCVHWDCLKANKLTKCM